MTDTNALTSNVAADDQPSRGTHLATLGFLMAATGAVVVLVASLAFGLEVGDVAFFAIPLVLSLIGAALVRRRQTAAKIVAIVLAVLAGFTVFWTIFGLFSPSSVFDFVPALLVVPGVLLALFAGIASIRAQGRWSGVVSGEPSRPSSGCSASWPSSPWC